MVRSARCLILLILANYSIILSFSAFIFAAYAIEKAVLAHIQKQLKKVAAAASAPASAPGSTTGFETPIITLLQIVNVFVLVTVPSFIIFTFQQNPLSNIFTLLLITCVFCKLWSYGDVNSRLRVQYIEKNLQGIAKRKAESSEVEPSLWKVCGLLLDTNDQPLFRLDGVANRLPQQHLPVRHLLLYAGPDTLLPDRLPQDAQDPMDVCDQARV